MEAYMSHAVLLERAVDRFSEPGALAGVEAVASPSVSIDALQELVTRSDRHRDGVFFTPERLANALWACNPVPLTTNARVFDPAAGAGALLRPVVRELSAMTESRLDQITLQDLHDSFVRTARAQLVLDWSTLRPGEVAAPEASSQDYLATGLGERVDTYTHIVLNPPYSMRQPSPGQSWAHGRINIAAEFVTRAIDQLDTGGVLLAILPDVLRSGSRYREWRQLIASMGEIAKVKPLGQFSDDADVDVFVLVFVRGDSGSSWPVFSRVGTRLDEVSEIRVGNVVPHRDPLEGPTAPFLTARDLSGELQRQHNGRLFEAPFLAVKRTTRPRDRPRLKVTLIDEPGMYAVENHLLVIKLRDEFNEKIRDIQHQLMAEDVSAHLDELTGCRHLTVSALKSLRVEDLI